MNEGESDEERKWTERLRRVLSFQRCFVGQRVIGDGKGLMRRECEGGQAGWCIDHVIFLSDSDDNMSQYHENGNISTAFL
jgi:hypothetical protein